MNEWDELLPGRLRTMRIIALAIIGGIVGLLVIVLAVIPAPRNGPGIGPPGLERLFLSLVAVLLLVACGAASVLLPWLLTQSALRKIARGTWQPPPQANPGDYGSDAARLLAVRQTSHIVGLAPLEAAAFFACIAYMMERQPLALAVAGVALLLILIQFPTQGREEAWLERQTEWLAEARHLGTSLDA